MRERNFGGSRNEFERPRGSVTFLRYHVVFTTKYRRKAITARVLTTTLTSFEETCATKGWTLEETNSEADHVHILLGFPPRDTL